jgi:hypothetical protein
VSTVGYATLQIIPSVRGIGDELRRQLVSPAAEAGERAGEEGGGGFRHAFEGALAALGVEALAEKAGEFFSEAFSQAVEQSNITSKLQAQLGASDADASKYGAEVGRLYSKGITTEFEQGAEVIRSIVNGHLVDPKAASSQLDAVARQMADVSNTFETDLGRQAEAVSAILKNKLAPDASTALDVITVGFQKLGPNAEDLLDTFQEYPVQLKKLGIDAKTSLGLFQQGLQGGARDTDIIADALKEFSIRSIDMSTTSRAAYQQLGFNHKQTIALEKQIASGGKGATAGLTSVLDRLRAIHNPVKREAAAVGLFGTQAEDLGSALFKLDPRSAVTALGNVDGAANQLGKDLRSGPSYEITLFKRTVQQGLVRFIGGQVLPILARWGKTFDDDVLPPLSRAGGVLSASFLPTLAALVVAGRGTVNFFRQWGIWLVPIAILIGGITLAMTANAIATGISTAAWNLWLGTLAIGEAVTGGFTAAMTLLNSVMALNPFVLVAIAVLALGAALVIAWKKSDTFRRGVMAAWQGIETAALATWRDALKPTIDGLVTGWQAVAAGALWLWRTVLAPTFAGIGLGAKILATIIGVTLYVAFRAWLLVVQLVAAPIITALRAVGAVGLWLWSAVFSPVIALLIGGAKLWWSGVKLYVTAVMTVIRAAGAVGLWLWTSVFRPVFGWIVAGAKLWWTGVLLYVTGVKTVLLALGTAAMWVYQHAVSPALHGMATVAQWLYDKGIKPPLDKGKQLAKSFGQAFVDAKNTIGTEWGKLDDLAKKPIAFIIDTVYNKGLVGVWNRIASAFGAPKLGTFKGFATGGPVFGAGTETSDDVPAWLSRNEHVWTAKEVRGAGGHARVMALRKWAAAGADGPVPGFKHGGGLFGWVGSATNAVAGAGSAAWNTVKKGAGWLKDTLAASARAGVRAVVEPLINQIPGLDTGWGKLVKHLPEAMIDALFGYADRADKDGASSSTAGGVHASPSQAQSIARKMLAQFGWGVDQWGPLKALWTGESGWRWNAENKASGAYGIPQSLPASKMAAAGKDWRTNAATQIKWGEGYIKGRYGDPATAYASWLSHSPHWYDSGGPLAPGLTLAANGTGSTEFVLTDSQYATAARALAHVTAQARSTPADRAPAPASAGLAPGDRVYLVVEDGPTLAAYVDTRVDTALTPTRMAASAGRRTP